MRKILKRFWAAIAGWSVLSTTYRLESFCAQHDPLFEEYVDLPIFLSEKISLLNAETEISNSQKDLWFHLIKDHGGPWKSRKPFFACYSPSEHEHIEQTLQFWLRNINRLKKELPPITNPLWLERRNPNGIIRLERKLIESANSQYGAKLIVLISSNVESFLQDVESWLILPLDEKERMLSITLKKGRDLQITSADERLKEESAKWFKKEVAV
jgi:hypothetical protein